jgi:hypothetical protein
VHCTIGGIGSGVASGATCVVGSTHTTLQAALDDGACPDVGVPAGNHSGAFTVGRDVVLVGDGRDASVLAGDGTSTVFAVTGSASVELRDLEVAGGAAIKGGGVSVATGAALTLTRSDVCGNAATVAGGGLHVEGTLTMVDAAVRLNSVTGDAIFGGGIALELGTLTADADTVIGENTATGSTVAGAGLSIVAGTATLTGTRVTENDALANAGDVDVTGGGVACACSGADCATSFTNPGTLTINGDAIIDLNTVEGTLATLVGGRVGGGGISAHGCTVDIDSVSIVDNVANANTMEKAELGGGGLAIHLSLFNMRNAHVDRNSIADTGGNTANWPRGGGLFLADSSGTPDPDGQAQGSRGTW